MTISLSTHAMMSVKYQQPLAIRFRGNDRPEPGSVLEKLEFAMAVDKLEEGKRTAKLDQEKFQDILQSFKPMEKESLSQFNDDVAGPTCLLELFAELKNAVIRKLENDLQTKKGLSAWWFRRKQGGIRASAGVVTHLQLNTKFHKSRHELVTNSLKALGENKLISVDCGHANPYRCSRAEFQISKFGEKLLDSGLIPAFRDQIKAEVEGKQ